VRFFHPQSPLSPDHVADLSVIVNKKTLPSALPTLRHARRAGTVLWNNLQAVILFSSRLVGLRALSEMGFLIPEVSFEKPDGEYVAKGYYIWNDEPELNGEGDFYQELIPTEPVDYKYYAVNDGSQIHVAGRRVTSKLYGEKQFLGQIETKPALQRRSEILLNDLTFGVSGLTWSKMTTASIGLSMSTSQLDTGTLD
ncbi:MAG: hypothetical protein V5A55_11495, partial [Halovenus sp.]